MDETTMIFYVQRFGGHTVGKFTTIESIHTDKDEAYQSLRELKELDVDPSSVYNVIDFNPVLHTWSEHVQYQMEKSTGDFLDRFPILERNSLQNLEPVIEKAKEKKKPKLTIVK